MVSFVPSKKRFVFTVRANQLVVRRLVENSGASGVAFVSVVVEVNTRFVPTVKPTIWTVGGGGGSTIWISPEKP